MKAYCPWGWGEERAQKGGCLPIGEKEILARLKTCSYLERKPQNKTLQENAVERNHLVPEGDNLSSLKKTEEGVFTLNGPSEKRSLMGKRIRGCHSITGTVKKKRGGNHQGGRKKCGKRRGRDH